MFHSFSARRHISTLFASVTLAGTLAGTASATIQTVYVFSATNATTPQAAPIQAADGSFYGTASTGGSNNVGAIYHILADGSIQTIATFDGGNGATPQSPLTLGSDGSYYGTTYNGGANGLGTIYKVTPSGRLTSLYSFSGTDGANPQAGLTLGSDGNYYGVTAFGGAKNYGSFFRITPNGAFTALASFDGANTGSLPKHTLTLGQDGYLYGTARTGGSNGYGTIFKASIAGSITPIYAFDNRNGAYPESQLTLASDGKLYGTASSNNAVGNKYGVAFSITNAGKYAVLARFNGKDGGTGRDPEGALVQGSDGNFYGTTHGRTNDAAGATALGTLFALTPKGSLTTLSYFYLTNSSGRPQDGVILGKDGNFYGVTSSGGAAQLGTVYRANTAGTLSTFSTFYAGLNNGAYPVSTVTEGADGNLYGTTTTGGGSTGNGDGTVYKLTPDGTLTTLANFDGSNGELAVNSLRLAADGNFYSTTMYGGSANLGTVFRVTPSGNLTTLVSFNGSNGFYPGADLTISADGNFYSTTCGDGVTSLGTVFKMTPTGALTTVANFDASTGTCPQASVTQAADGNFYGATTKDGANNVGTIFRMTPDGTISSITDLDTDKIGYGIYQDLTVGSDGALYGLNNLGGTNNTGTLFRVDLTGHASAIVTFDNLAMGGHPFGTLIPDGTGGFYGTTESGGTNTLGTLFYAREDGTFLVLDAFSPSDVASSNGLTMTHSGVLYGTAYFGPQPAVGAGYGSVYRWIAN